MIYMSTPDIYTMDKQISQVSQEVGYIRELLEGLVKSIDKLKDVYATKEEVKVAKDIADTNRNIFVFLGTTSGAILIAAAIAQLFGF